jgi:nucleoside-diphosphate-sugar epimerase
MSVLLLTGADGFIGSQLVPILGSSFRTTLWAGGKTDYPSIRVSLTEQATYPAVVEPIHQVIHGAALTKKVNPDPTPPELYRAINVDGTRILLSWLDTQPLAHILYVSTCDVYGSVVGEISEATCPAPAEPYAESKLAGEDAVRTFADARGIAWAVARLGNVYGPGEGAYGKFIPAVIERALLGSPIRINGIGATRRDCIFVGDVARALAWIAERRLTGIFNVVSGTAVSLKSIAETVVREAGSASDIVLDPTRGDGPDRVFAASRLHASGWQPALSLGEGLRAEIDFQRSCRG